MYPQETFDVAKKYGCNLWLNNDDGLSKYLHTVLQQTKGGFDALVLAQDDHYRNVYFVGLDGLYMCNCVCDWIRQQDYYLISALSNATVNS